MPSYIIFIHGFLNGINFRKHFIYSSDRIRKWFSNNIFILIFKHDSSFTSEGPYKRIASLYRNNYSVKVHLSGPEQSGHKILIINRSNLNKKNI